MEPTFVALGPTHVALGMNNHGFPHPLLDGCADVGTREYVSTVEAIRLSHDFVGVLSEGRLPRLADHSDSGGIGAVSRSSPRATASAT